MKLSILTATYNRARLLPNLYASLLKNYDTFTNFEWLIMDDGSTDDTEKLVNSWMNDNKIDIKYYKQKNQGKMAAINKLVPKAKGDLIIEMDSDDYFVDNAFSIIDKDYKKLSNIKNVYGLLYSKKLGKTSKVIPDSFSESVMRLFDIHYRYNLDYDMAIVFLAKFRKKYKYDLEHNERFVTEARTYYKMDHDSDGLLVCNNIIMNCDYQEDGYTKHIVELFKKYPYGYFCYFKELLNYPSRKILFKRRLYMIKHYILFGYLTSRSFIDIIQYVHGFNKFLIIVLYLPGIYQSKKKFNKI